MNGHEHLKLVALYDANRNEYSISAHNLGADEAQRLVAESQPECQPGYSFITLDQRGRHRTEEARNCRTCRDAVAYSANLNPKPKFKQRRTE